ncbi:MAG: DegV family protein [Eubacteriales bacterium]
MADDLLISVDSTTSLTEELQKHNNVIKTDLTYYVDGEERFDAFSDALEKSKVYDELRDGAKASPDNITPKHFMEDWKPLLQAGKTILHLSVSSKICSAFRSASIAADALNSVYPDKIRVFDTLIAGGCVADMALEAADMSAKGASVEQIVVHLMQERDKYNLLICVDDISHAKEDGIINTFQAVIGEMIGIRPILYTTTDGRITLGGIARGLKNVYSLGVDIMDFAKSDETTWALVEHAGDEYNALTMIELIRDRIKQIKKTEVGVISPIIGINAGPGMVCIYFKGKSRNTVSEYAKKLKKNIK